MLVGKVSQWTYVGWDGMGCLLFAQWIVYGSCVDVFSPLLRPEWDINGTSRSLWTFEFYGAQGASVGPELMSNHHLLMSRVILPSVVGVGIGVRACTAQSKR